MINFISNTIIPLISSVFQGTGIELCKRITSFFCRRTNKENQSPPGIPNPTSSESLTNSTVIHKQILLSDLEQIQRTINFGLSSDYKKDFLRYFNKYKSFFSADDTFSLNNQASNSTVDYFDLLTQLQGLIESLLLIEF